MHVSEQVRVVTAENFRLQLPSEVAGDIARQINEAANALPKRGLESGGLLLGTVCGPEFTVNSMIPIACRYAGGPAFRLTEQELEDALQAARLLGNPVGIYRSRNDGSLELDSQDARLLDLLALPTIPILLIRQQKNTFGEGRLLIWHGGTEGSALSAIGEIFQVREWMPVPFPVRDRKQHSFVALPPPIQPVPPPNPPNLRISWILAAASLLFLPLAFIWQTRPTTNQPVPVITIEPSAPPPPLVITPRPMESHEPPSSFATVKSWIRNKDNAVLREIAVSLLARHWKYHPDTLPLLKAAAATDPSPGVRAAARNALPHNPDLVQVAKPQLPLKPPDEPQKPASKLKKLARLFRPPWLMHSEPSTPAVLPEPTPVVVGRPSSLPSVDSPKFPALGDTYRPPVLVQKTQVYIPPDLRASIRRDANLAFRIHVDKKGGVSKVESIEQTSRLERSMEFYYADAIQHWRFEPARRNDKAVPAEIVLRFRVSR